MQKFSMRTLVIFVICALVATIAIGLGVGYVVKLKHLVLSSSSYGLHAADMYVVAELGPSRAG